MAEPTRARRIALAAVLAAVALVCDLGSKAWAWDALRGGGRKVIVQGVLRFEFAFNTGSAFGFLQRASSARIAFIVITVAILLYLGVMLRRLPPRVPSAFAAVGLFAGGAMGNLHDRLFREMWIFDQGDRFGVVDFIVISLGDRTWPAFNIADLALALGVGLLLLSLYQRANLKPQL